MRSDSLLLLKQEYSAAFLCWWYTDIFLRKKTAAQKCATTYLFTLIIFMMKTLKITIDCGEQRYYSGTF